MTEAAEQLCVDTDARLELARELVTSMEQGSNETTDRIIDQLYSDKEQTLFQEIGKLTRQLHDALGNCRNDERISSIAEVDMPDARERLAYVIEKTSDSAHKTLGYVEAALPLSDQLKSEAVEMTEEWERFKRREMSAEDFRDLSKRLEKFLAAVNANNDEIHEHLTAILLAQDFQDLTGQIISRVINIVEQVEQGLVGMIRKCGEKKEETAKAGPNIDAEGPLVNADKRNDVVNGQNAVDDLLSSLGF